MDTARKVSAAVNVALESFRPVSASIGVAWFGDADRLFPEILKAADELMYEVKASGKASMRSRRYTEAKKTASQSQE